MQTITKGAGPVGSRLHEGAAGGWSSLRPPDATLEPEDEAFHLHRAWRHLHHRPAEDAAARAGSPRLRAQHRRAWRHDPVRRHEEAGAARDSRRGHARRHAVRLEPLARRPAHELAHDHRSHRLSPRPAAPQGGRPARAAAGQGAHRDGGRAGEARVEPRRRVRDASPAGRGVHRRPEEGAACGARGAAPEAARDRPRRHELRPGRGGLRDPRQRRRHPLVLADRACHRRRDRDRAEQGVGQGVRRRRPGRGGGRGCRGRCGRGGSCRHGHRRPGHGDRCRGGAGGGASCRCSGNRSGAGAGCPGGCGSRGCGPTGSEASGSPDEAPVETSEEAVAVDAAAGAKEEA